jgi:Holliday junction resolvasome RuvABC endonuclease subunit
MRRIIGVDPGPELSGMVIIDESLKVLEHYDQIDVDGIDDAISLFDFWTIVVEDLSPRGGFSVGKMMAQWGKTIQTAKVIGQIKRIAFWKGLSFVESNPSTWRAKFCGTASASPAQIKACVRDVYESRGLACGGGKQPAQGVKSKPGPLYGLKGHAWDALGVALTYVLMEEGR